MNQQEQPATHAMQAEGAIYFPLPTMIRDEIAENDPISLVPTVQLAISTHFHNKDNRSTQQAFSRDWATVSYTPRQIADHITRGHAICIAALTNDHRQRRSFQSAQIIGLDLDNGPDITTLLAIPFIRDHAFLVYATASSTPENPRSRVLFILDETICDAKLFQENVKRLIAFLATHGIQADPACKDSVRMFYGSTQPGFSLRPDKVLSLSVLEALPVPEKRARRSQRKGSSAAAAPVFTKSQSAFSDLIASALACIPPQGEYDTWLRVLMAVHSVLPDQQGINLIEAWSPGEDGAVAAKFASFREPDEASVTIDFLWSVARSYGWQEVLALVPDLQVHMRYISDMELPLTGAYVIKSGMNTGKSELIKRLIKSWHAQHGRLPRILVITHRRLLALSLARRFGIDNYVDLSEDELPHSDRLACTLNSLHKLLAGNQLQPFDIIILDEVEQQLTHLMGSTFEKAQAVNALNTLISLIERATCVLALDAHAGTVCLDWLRSMRPDVTFLENTYVLNRGYMNLFKGKGAWLNDLFEQIERETGKPLPIFCSEKSAVKTLESLLRDRYPELRIRVFHGDNSQQRETQDFIEHINERLSEIDVLIASPTLGTGIDITAEVGVVYGFFTGNDLTAEDLHQMLGRCRKATDFRVYLTGHGGDRETDAQQLYSRYMSNLQRTGLICEYDPYGNAQLAASQQRFLQLQCAVEAARNDALNHRYTRFLALARPLFKLEFIQYDVEEAREAYQDNEKAHQATWEAAILAATPVSAATYQAALKAHQLTPELQLGYERGKIEAFYVQQLTPELLQEWDHGKGEAHLSRFQHLFLDIEATQHRDRQEESWAVAWGKRHHFTIKRQLVVQALHMMFGEDLDTTPMPVADFEKRLYGPFEGWVTAHEADLRDYLGRRSHQNGDPLNILRHCLKLVGLKLSITYEGKKRDKFYALDPLRLVTMQNLTRIQLQAQGLDEPKWHLIVPDWEDPDDTL